MGRPISKKHIGALSASGEQIRIYGILDIGTGIEALYIRKQINPSKFLCSDPTNTRTGFITLQQETPNAIGEGRIEVLPYGASSAAATARMKAVGVAIVSGGSGYSAGNILSVVGGAKSTTTLITVDTVDGSGVILTAHISTAGNYSVLPTDPVSVTGGAGTLATFNVDWGVLSIAVTDGGSGYEDAPAISFSGGGGSSSAAHAVLSGDAVGSIVVDTAGSGYTSTPSVVIAGSKSYAKNIQSRIVKTFEGNIYKFRYDVAASAIGEADIDTL